MARICAERLVKHLEVQGQNQLPKVVKGAKFRDGIEIVLEAKFAA